MIFCMWYNGTARPRRMTKDEQMPVKEQITVRPGAVRLGDPLISVPISEVVNGKKVAEALGVVAKSNTKTKNVVITLESGDEFTIRADAEVTVERQVATFEEKRERAEAEVRHALEAHVDGEAKAQAAFDEYAAKNGFVYAIKWGHAGDVIEARVFEGYAQNVLTIVNEGRGSYIEALDWAAAQASRTVIMAAQRPASRSTSVWSNLTEDHEVAAASKIADLNSFGSWIGGSDYALRKILQDEG